MMVQDDRINYLRIGQAQLLYKALGYRNIETPWIVTEEAVKTTLPKECRPFTTVGGALVGSAEQGFIDLMLDGFLEPGRYQSTTPCFRDEQPLTELTRQYFMKLELIHYMPTDQRADYERMLNQALGCFFEISECDTFEARDTSEGIDIFLNGIEIGSYGVRTVDNHTWIYGTGLAEPRFSIASRLRPVPAVEATPQDSPANA
jgi:hypothetical protein